MERELDVLACGKVLRRGRGQHVLFVSVGLGRNGPGVWAMKSE